MNGGVSTVELVGKITVTTIIAVIFASIFVVCFRIIIKRLFRRDSSSAAATPDLHPADNEKPQGLSTSVLKTLTVVAFDPEEFPDGAPHCAVCLSEVSAGETARLLPGCRHGFHLKCIDAWFQSHSTCPLCRRPVTTHGGACGEPSGSPLTGDREKELRSGDYGNRVLDLEEGI